MPCLLQLHNAHLHCWPLHSVSSDMRSAEFQDAGQQSLGEHHCTVTGPCSHTLYVTQLHSQDAAAVVNILPSNHSIPSALHCIKIPAYTMLSFSVPKGRRCMYLKLLHPVDGVCCCGTWNSARLNPVMLNCFCACPTDLLSLCRVTIILQEHMAVTLRCCDANLQTLLSSYALQADPDPSIHTEHCYAVIVQC